MALENNFWNKFDEDIPLPEELPLGKGSATYCYTEAVPFALSIQYIAGLTTMHPSIAEAVDKFSTFREAPYKRALLTIDAASQLASNREEEVRAMASRLHNFHSGIKGSYPSNGSPEKPNTHYGANMSDLQAWVIACSQIGIEQSYTRWVGPMSFDEKEALYKEQRAIGLAMGIPGEVLPSDRDGLEKYIEDMINGGVLGSTETSRRVTRDVLTAPFLKNKLLALPARVFSAVSVTMVEDPRLREKFGLQPNQADLFLARLADIAVKNSWSRLPKARKQAFVGYLTLRRHLIRSRNFASSAAKSLPLVGAKE